MDGGSFERPFISKQTHSQILLTQRSALGRQSISAVEQGTTPSF